MRVDLGDDRLNDVLEQGGGSIEDTIDSPNDAMKE